MQEVSTLRSAPPMAGGYPGYGVQGVGQIDPRRWLAVIVRRAPLFAVVAGLVFAIVMLVAVQATPYYDSSVSILVDAHQKELLDVGTVQIDNNLIDTDAQILKSRSLALDVVKRLGLDKDPEFIPPRTAQSPLWFVTHPLALIHTAHPARVPGGMAPNLYERAADVLMGHVNVKRNGLTYVIDLTVTSKSPLRAAQIAAAYGEAYIASQLAAKNDLARSTNNSLGARVDELRQDAEQADNAVQQYKVSHNLVTMDFGPNSGTLAGQEVSALNQQIAMAEADRTEKEAQLAAARAQIKQGGNGEDVGSTLQSDTIRNLRSQEALGTSNLAQLLTHYGPKHPEVLKQQGQLADIREQIKQQITRIISSLEADASVARQRVASLRSSQAEARGSLVSNNVSQAGLLELQRRADAAHTIYETLLGKAKESSAKEGVIQPDARIVSYPRVNRAPSFPNIRMAALFGLAAGVVAGLGSVILVHWFSSGLETGADIEKRFGLPFAGSIPVLRSTLNRGASGGAPHDYIIEHPFSAFAESLRSIRTFLMLPGPDSRPPKVIAITSALPREGKSMTSFCLARTMALAGSKVVLVDGDLRRRGASSLAHPGKVGLVEVLNGECKLQDALVKDDRSEAWILPVITPPKSPRDLFATPAMDQLLDDLRRNFDFVLMDTAPVLAVAETRLLAAKADATLVLTQWRKTPFKACDVSVEMLIEAGANIAGVALTRTDLRQQSRFGYGDRYYYYRAYSSYYTN